MTTPDAVLVDPDTGFLAAVHQAISAGFLGRYELTDDLVLEAGVEVADKLDAAAEWDTAVDWVSGAAPAPSVAAAMLDLFPAADRPTAAKLVGVIIRWYAPAAIGHRLDLLVAGV